MAELEWVDMGDWSACDTKLGRHTIIDNEGQSGVTGNFHFEAFDESEAKRIAQVIEDTLMADRKDHEVTLIVSAGNSGEDAREWVNILSRMYKMWALRRGFDVENRLIDDATIELTINSGLDRLIGEVGVHGLTRISPFDDQHRRHTCFARVDIERHATTAASDTLIRRYTLDPHRLVINVLTGESSERVDEVLYGAFDTFMPGSDD